jgi:hypothetical protein
MANTLVNTTMILNESLALLSTKCKALKAVYRGYDDRFGDKVELKPGTSLQIRKPSKFTVGTGKKLQVQDDLQETVTISCTQQIHVGIPAFTSEQLAMNINGVKKLILEPAMSVIAAKIDNMVMQHGAENFHMNVGTPGTTPANDEPILSANAKLDQMNAMEDDRYALITPKANAALLHGFVGLYNPSTLISEQFNTGYVKSSLGLDIAQTNNVYRVTCGTRTGTILVDDSTSTNIAEGMTVIHMDAFGGATQTWKKGEKFEIAGVYSVTPEMKINTGDLQQFTITADGAASGSEGDVYYSPAIYATGARQNVTALPVNDAGVTFKGTASTSYPYNLIMHKNAMTLVTADLPLFRDTHTSRRDKLEGISMRFQEFSDGINDELLGRFDVYCGVSTMYNEMGVVLFG